MAAGEELEMLLATMAKLRGPDGCPWDRAQTMATLRPYVLEEAHELVDAIRAGDSPAICEELGDLLLEVVFVTQIAIENNLFTMTDVARGIREKLIRRHPHVFSELRATNADEALEHWDAIKEQEKPERQSALDGVPRSLPALSRAAKLSKRASSVGFDWDSVDGIHDKIREELDELDEARRAGDADGVHEEIGDLLFAVVNLARYAGADPELALKDANDKFASRFRHMERALNAEGQKVEDTDMEELERRWWDAKTSDRKER